VKLCSESLDRIDFLFEIGCEDNLIVIDMSFESAEVEKPKNFVGDLR
jgi:hypothetical protein